MGYAIPAPQDPKEAQAWEQRVRQRQARLFRESVERLLLAQDLVLVPIAD